MLIKKEVNLFSPQKEKKSLQAIRRGPIVPFPQEKLRQKAETSNTKPGARP